MLADSVRKQSIQIFQNIGYIFDDLTPEILSKKLGGFFVWKQIYHLLHSIDKNFIDPSHFTEPEIHTKNLDIIFLETGPSPGLDALLNYFREIQVKLESYLALITDEKLEETIHYKSLTLTRMELILAQFRHIFYHIGYLHCCIKIELGRTPEYVSLFVAVPEN